MHRALLHELQLQSGYPCVTILVNTTPSLTMTSSDIGTIAKLIDDADRRLVGDVPNATRRRVITSLHELLIEECFDRSSNALALCASPTYVAAVRLGRPVATRVVVDHSFATRDLVADLHRSARYRVVTVSERMVRVLYGDPRRLAEQVDEHWPLVRDGDQSLAAWTRAVVHALRAEQRRHPVPTVVAGVERSVRRAIDVADVEAIGVVHGNHDRAGWHELHRATWPVVEEWVERQESGAIGRLDHARSQRRLSCGLEEVWSLAKDGRLDFVVVEESYAVSARIVDGRLETTDDREAVDVVDDVVDEIIEAVIRYGGEAAIVSDGRLGDLAQIAAIARY
jgi:hypothetical protein